MRNIYASLLLFLKEGLSRNSPSDSNEVLLKANILPIRDHEGRILFLGSGSKTVNSHTIQERYKSLGIQINWAPFEKIQKERNNIEHYYSTTPIDVVQSVICNASTFIIDILKKVLNTDPASTLGPTWKQITGIFDIYQPIKDNCNKTFNIFAKNKLMPPRAKALMEDFSCPECNSKLLYLFTGQETPSEDVTIKIDDPDNCELICYACHSKVNLVEAFEEFAEDGYEVALDDLRGGHLPVVKECPACGHETFIDDYSINSCIYCDGRKEYEHCDICGRSLSLEEQEFDGLCMDCDYNYQKAMSDD